MVSSFAYYIMKLKRDFVDFCNERLQKIGLSQGQLLFLIYIGKHEYCSPKELANALHMDSGHATRTIVKLVESGFILQTLNPNDKRAHILTLTKKGKEAFCISHELFKEWDEKMLSDVSIEQRQELMLIMETLVHHKADEWYY